MHSEVVRVLRDLIAIPSVNPALPVTQGTERAEAGVADYVESFLQRIGIDCQRQPILPGRENIIAFIEGQRNAPVLVLEAHMDTVSVDTMTIAPFEPVVRDGRVYGRGACDTKGSLAAMLMAIKSATKIGKPYYPVLLAATVDEEYGYEGAKGLAKWLGETCDLSRQPHYGVVGEPTELSVVIAHKGAVRGSIRTAGVSAHSSQPDAGINAIYRMARVINALERYHRDVLSEWHHPLVGPPTLSVSMIRGGQAPNVVPDECEITIDRRTLPAEDPIQAWKALMKYVRESEGIDFDVQFRQPSLIDMGMEVPVDSPIVQRARNAVQVILGRADLVGVSYGTDASKLAACGIPSVVLGPGSIKQAHAAVEFIEIEQLEQAVAIYLELISRE